MSPSIGVNLRVTGHSHQGGRKYMEDIFSVAYQSTPDEKDLEYAFFGIFDGHGGREAAQFAKDHLMDYIVKQKHFWSDRDDDVLKAIHDGFIATHHAMWSVLDTWPRTASGLPSTSGTTASVAFLRRGRIYIGHVGDSSIVLGLSENRDDNWQATALTSDHKPESAEESRRIYKAGGKVAIKLGVPRVVWNRPKPGHKGPIRRSTPFDEVPFLAVARALGDLWSHNQEHDMFVVSPEPDVHVFAADASRHRCLILGTDGLWNVMSPLRAVQIVQETERYNEACYEESHESWINPSHCLVEKALEQWANLKLRADNTSVVTLMLDPPGPPRFQVRPLGSARNSNKNSQHAEKRVRPAPELESLPPDPNRGGIREVANMLQARVMVPKNEPEPVCCAETKEVAEIPTPSKTPRKEVSTPEETKGRKRQSPSPANTVPSKKRSLLGLGENRGREGGRATRLFSPSTTRELRSQTLPPRRRVRPSQPGK